MQLLQSNTRESWIPEADEIIQFITSGTDRMRHMVLDLLSYAQTVAIAIIGCAQRTWKQFLRRPCRIYSSPLKVEGRVSRLIPFRPC